jgi:ABC-type lipoprotein release transport system permease subunit
MKTFITLAWRNIWRNKRRSYINIASVLFAVLLAIAADSFERGSYELMIDNMVKFSTGYIQVQDVLYDEEPSIDNAMLYDEALQEKLDEFGSDIEYTVPRIQNFALAATDNRTRGAFIMGIDPESEDRFNKLSENLVEGEFLKDGDRAVMLAAGFSDILGLGIGDTLILIGQGFQGVSAAGMFPVKGIVKLSVPDMNNNTVYMPIATAQWFYGAEGRLTSLIIMPVKPAQTTRLTNSLNKNLDGEWYVAHNWQYLLSDLLKMMKMDMAGSRMITYILYIVIGFGLFGTVLTMMLERLKEFAMLISIGMKRYQLAIVCFFETLFMSFIGVIVGTVLTYPILLYFNINPIPLKGEMAELIEEYGFEAVMPTSVTPDIFINQIIIVFLLALIIGLFPVYKVFRLKVVDAVK